MNGVAIADTTAPDFLATQNGSYYVVVTNSSGVCPGTGPVVDFTLSTVGLVHGDISAMLSAYPNPTINTVFIQSNEKFQQINVIDMYGKTLKSLVNNEHEINVSDLLQGMYSLMIVTKDGKKGIKTIVKL